MDDHQNNRELAALIKQAKDTLDPKSIHTALKIAMGFEDIEERSWYLSEIVVLQATIGEIEESIQIAKMISLPIEKVHSLIAIASVLAQEPQQQRANSILAEAEIAAEDIEGDPYWKWQKAEAMDNIALAYVQAGESGKAIMMWNSSVQTAKAGQFGDDPQDIFDCSSVLSVVAMHLAEAGYLDKAKHVAESIRIDHKRQGALEEIARIAN